MRSRELTFLSSVLFLMLSLVAPKIYAGEFQMDTAGCKQPSTAVTGEVSAVRMDDNTTGTNPVTTWLFSASATKVMYCPVPYPGDAPATAAPFTCQLWAHNENNSSGTACLRVTMMQPGSDIYSYLTFGTAVAISNTVGPGQARIPNSYIFNLIGVGGTSAIPDSPTQLKIERVDGLGGCGNTNSGTMGVDWITCSY